MPENARTPLGAGVLVLLVGFALTFSGGPGAAIGFVLHAIGVVLVAVGVIAWGVWLAIDQWERDRGEGRWSRIRMALDDGEG